MKIFISYRRDDSADISGRIYDRLVVKYERDDVFKDVDDIPFGVDFRKVLDDEVKQCDLLLAVIGRDWLNIKDKEGNRRIDNPTDFVRIEIESALNRGIPVIPLFVRGAGGLPADELPEGLHNLSFMNGISIRRDPDFHHDMDRLIGGLEDIGQLAQEKMGTERKSKESADLEVKEKVDAERKIKEKANEDAKRKAQPAAIRKAKEKSKQEIKNHIFISYALADNEPLMEGEKGWVTNLEYTLERMLDQKLRGRVKIWRDPEIRGDDAFATTIIEQLSTVATFVLVMSPSYINSKWCEKELNGFIEAAEQTGGLEIGNRNRIFKVIKNPVPSSEQPPLIAHMLGYEFYEIDPDGRVIPYGRAFGDEYGVKLLKKMSHLSDDISELLKIIESGE